MRVEMEREKQEMKGEMMRELKVKQNETKWMNKQWCNGGHIHILISSLQSFLAYSNIRSLWTLRSHIDALLHTGIKLGLKSKIAIIKDGVEEINIKWLGRPDDWEV